MSNTGQIVDDPFRAAHNEAAKREAIKEILKDGTPDWYTHPEDYKNFARENYLRDKEESDSMASGYKLEYQELFEDQDAARYNVMSTRAFCLKLMENGLHVSLTYAGLPQTVGLHVRVPGWSGPEFKYICYLQTPAMPEWSVVKLNEHGVAIGEDYRGWRSVLWSLIKAGILTEEKAHAIFGEPHSLRSKKYRRDLWLLRNGFIPKS